jgi:hypothetical protein
VVGVPALQQEEAAEEEAARRPRCRRIGSRCCGILTHSHAVVVSVAAAILAGPEVRAVRVVVRGQAEELEEPQWPRADHAAGLDTPPPVPTQRRGLGRGEHA